MTEELFEAKSDRPAYINETGELHCPYCSENEIIIKAKEKRITALELENGQLRKKLEDDDSDSPLWREAIEIYDVWKRACNHPRSKFDSSIFKILSPFIEKDGKELCVRAIAGAAFDCYKSKRANGTTHVHNDLDLIFRNRPKYEEFVRKAKLPWNYDSYMKSLYEH